MSAAAILIENIAVIEEFASAQKMVFTCSIKYPNDGKAFRPGSYIFTTATKAKSFLEVLKGLVVVEKLEEQFRVEYCFSTNEEPQINLNNLDISYGPFDDLEKDTIHDLRTRIYRFLQNNEESECKVVDFLFVELVGEIRKLKNFRNNEVLWFCYILSLFYLEDVEFRDEAKGFLEKVDVAQFRAIVNNLYMITPRLEVKLLFLISDLPDLVLGQSQICLHSYANRFTNLDELCNNVVENSVIVIYGHGSSSLKKIRIQVEKGDEATTATDAITLVKAIGKKIETLVLVACYSDDITCLADVKFLIKHNNELSASSFYLITSMLKKRLSKGLSGQSLFSYLYTSLFLCTWEYPDFEIIVNDC